MKVYLIFKFSAENPHNYFCGVLEEAYSFEGDSYRDIRRKIIRSPLKQILAVAKSRLLVQAKEKYGEACTLQPEEIDIGFNYHLFGRYNSKVNDWFNCSVLCFSCSPCAIKVNTLFTNFESLRKKREEYARKLYAGIATPVIEE